MGSRELGSGTGSRERGSATGSPERGSATLFALAFLGVLLFVGLALARVSGLVLDHRRAQAAADLAALAGAAPAGGCSAAADIAIANGARLTSCSRDGPDLVVTVAVASQVWPGHSVVLTASARAGPA
jgi:secretion/DNA translocation related TadE-like protein